MKIARIFYSSKIQTHSTITLPREASHHVVQVLRLKVNDECVIFNGRGVEYTARFTGVENKLARLQILRENTVTRESPVHIELAQAISRGDRMDYVMQKSVELGVNAIAP